VELVTN